jgi:hypothetical protein
MQQSLTDDQLEELRSARALLDNPGLAVRIASALAMPLDRVLALLPDAASGAVLATTERALTVALDTALWTLPTTRRPASTRAYRTIAALSGAAGGAFGLPGLSVELPLSTTLMLRAIADTARSEGENLQYAETRLACLQVLALGGHSSGDNAAESGYFALRAALASSVSDALRHLAAGQTLNSSAPALLRLLTRIAARYSVVVSEKMAAQAVPLLGAAGGATINSLFMDHFQQMARGHFTVRRLERRHGTETVRSAWLTAL